MRSHLQEMHGDWDAFFDATYLRTHAPHLEESADDEAHAAIALAGAAPGAAVLDVPCGFGRHSVPLAKAGYHVTGIDRSETQLLEARRRAGDAPWPQLRRADYRDLPFPDASFDAILCLFSSLGYLDRTGDVAVLGEFRRVLRPGARAIIETMHRDRLARIFQRSEWERLPDDTLFLQQRTFDAVAGTVASEQLLVTAEGKRTTRRFVHRIYTASEWAAMLHEAGFELVECFAGWTNNPVSPDERLVIRAR
jgi:ubiquinone/menaquinone biosynthesis C-methylase UbiE